MLALMGFVVYNNIMTDEERLIQYIETIKNDYLLRQFEGKHSHFTQEEIDKWEKEIDESIQKAMIEGLSKPRPYTIGYDFGYQAPNGAKIEPKPVPSKIPTAPPKNICTHDKKHVILNQANGIKFRYCKNCKTDLGTVV